MDYISAILQLDPLSNDELFQFPSVITSERETILEDKAVSSPPDEIPSDIIEKTKSGARQRKASEAFGVEIPGDNNKKKKVIHRDIERKRRQEMATLYGSLRNLLPLEYLKGKRSISDHVHQAVRYIKHQEEKIQELSDKRDELKRLFNATSSGDPRLGSSGTNFEDVSFTVNLCWVGVEVVVDTALREGLHLSKMLRLLIQEGLGIVSCISTRVNERMLHNIKCEVGYGRSIDISELQQKLKSSTVGSRS